MLGTSLFSIFIQSQCAVENFLYYSILSAWDLIPQVHLFEVLVDGRYFNDAEEGEEINLYIHNIGTRITF